MLRAFAFLFLLCPVLVSGNPAAASCSRDLVVAWTVWHPYAFEAGGRPRGMDVDIIKAVLDRAGCQHQFKRAPWKRTLAEVRAGTIDLATGASLTEERKEYARFSHAYRREYMTLFMRRAELSRYPLTALSGLTAYPDLRIAALAGSWYGHEFDHQMRDNAQFRRMVHLNTDYPLLFRWLKLGRMDVVLNDLYNGLHLLGELGALDEMDVHPYVVNDNFVHVMLSRQSTNEADHQVINAAISALRDEGAIGRIIGTYIPSSYSRFFIDQPGG